MRIKDLKINLEYSMDDKKDYSNFKLTTYNRDFINNKE